MRHFIEWLVVASPLMSPSFTSPNHGGKDCETFETMVGEVAARSHFTQLVSVAPWFRVEASIDVSVVAHTPVGALMPCVRNETASVQLRKFESMTTSRV